jgi:hypothetical protein
MCRAVRRAQIKLLVRSSKPASRFPGSHPVALTSKNIKQLLDDDYRVAPKIDGERRFLALLDERLYLIDRRMRVELFPAIRFPARYNRTIFDGEVVTVDQPPTAEGKNENDDNENENESEATRRWYFVIFDVVCAEGEYVCHMPLHERLNLAKPVIESVEAAPFELTFQDYHPLDRIHAVFRQQRLHHVGGGQGDETEAEAGKNEKEKSDDDDGEEDDDDNASFFPTDGLLFVPVYTPYRCVSCVVCRACRVVCAYAMTCEPRRLGYCERMMKWKPPAQNTIDFTLRSVTADVRHGHPAQEAKSESEGDDASQGESDVVFVKAADGDDSKAEAEAGAEAQDRTGDAEADAAPDQRRYWQLFVLRDSNNYVFYDWIEFSSDDDEEEKNDDEEKSESEESDVVRRHGLDADNCIIECHWDPAKKIAHPPPASLLDVWGRGWSSGKGGWRFHRCVCGAACVRVRWCLCAHACVRVRVSSLQSAEGQDDAQRGVGGAQHRGEHLGQPRGGRHRGLRRPERHHHPAAHRGGPALRPQPLGQPQRQRRQSPPPPPQFGRKPTRQQRQRLGLGRKPARQQRQRLGLGRRPTLP